MSRIMKHIEYVLATNGCNTLVQEREFDRLTELLNQQCIQEFGMTLDERNLLLVAELRAERQALCDPTNDSYVSVWLSTDSVDY